MNASPLIQKAAALRAGKLETENLEILPAPGALEAAAIREDHATATSGMRAFVRMGFRLMDVKSRLPHGEYIPWCEKFLKGLSKRHLHRAKFIAENFAKKDSCVLFEELPPEALAEIDGANESGGYRALLAEFQDFPEIIGSEADAKKACEARWERKPEERDEWEPRVLSGEMSYHRARTGMLGSVGTKGKARESTKIWTLMTRNANSMKGLWKDYSALEDEERKLEIVEKLVESLSAAPTDVQTAILAALEGRRA